MISRQLEDRLKSLMYKGKAIVLIGARQTGKTTLLHELVKSGKNVQWLDADDISIRNMIGELTIARLQTLFAQNDIIVVDEAQRVENIGIQMKLITDHLPQVQLFISGSSAFELANKVNEPLTGRKWEYQLYPFSFNELQKHFGMWNEIRNLPIRLVYGSYPDVVNNTGNEKFVLSQLTNSYLYKDILEWERIKHPDKLVKLLQALAYQVGSEVSYSELAVTVGIDKATVDKYINLLEQIQIVFRLGSFSRNLRNELKMSKKIYFYDNGIRNALIGNFNDINLRDDQGKLWENYMISEFKKKNSYSDNYCKSYFWRTTQQQEIDYIEEKDGKITAFEFKWNPKKKAKVSRTFISAYPNSEIVTISPDNYYEYLAGD